MADETGTTDQASTIDSQPTETVTLVQTDLQKIETAINDLRTAGNSLFTDEIEALEEKRDKLIAEAEAKLKEVETEIEEAEKTFIQKYGSAIVNGVEIILMIVVIGKLFNLI
jgi:flagellar hook-length control protein FliK